MDQRLTPAEIRVMNVVWNEGSPTARRICDVLQSEVGWGMTTVYTLIKRCVDKGAIERREPNYLCCPLVRREEVQRAETDDLIDRLFDGRAEGLFAALLDRDRLTGEQRDRLRRMIDERE